MSTVKLCDKCKKAGFTFPDNCCTAQASNSRLIDVLLPHCANCNDLKEKIERTITLMEQTAPSEIRATSRKRLWAEATRMMKKLRQ